MNIECNEIKNMKLSSPEKVYNAINKLWDKFPEYDKGRENLFVLYLDVKNCLLSIELHTQGTIDQALCYPREIIKKGLFVNAGALIIIHNHPSGNCSPSESDKILTIKIKDACKLMDILLLDHIIISDNGKFSFQNEGIL